MPRTPFTTPLEGKRGQDQPPQVLRTARLRAAAGKFKSDLFGHADPPHELEAVLNKFAKWVSVVHQWQMVQDMKTQPSFMPQSHAPSWASLKLELALSTRPLH